jgi:hypothetical protein
MSKKSGAIKHFISTFGQHNEGEVDERYKFHTVVIAILLCMLVFNRVLLSMVGDPQNLKAHYVEVNTAGIPLPQENLLQERPPEEIKAFFSKVIRKTFTLDSYGNYKSYRNTINRVNSEYFQLTWDSLNLTDSEFESGTVVDGNQSYYLKGQELVAVLFKAGIIKMLQEKELMFWIEIEPNGVAIMNSQPCDPDYCLRGAMTWNVELSAKLYMVAVNEKSKPKFLPIKMYGRVIASSKMLSRDGLMVERLAAKIGDTN